MVVSFLPDIYDHQTWLLQALNIKVVGKFKHNIFKMLKRNEQCNSTIIITRSFYVLYCNFPMCVRQSVCLSVHSSVCSFICLSVHSSVIQFVPLLVVPFVVLFFIPSFHPFVRSSVCLLQQNHLSLLLLQKLGQCILHKNYFLFCFYGT